MMSPLGIVLAGAGAAAGIVAGLPLVAAAGVGALAWGGRVLAAVPKDAPSARVAAEHAERAVAVVRHAGRGVQAALRPRRRVRRRRAAARAPAAAVGPPRRGHRRVVADRPAGPRDRRRHRPDRHHVGAGRAGRAEAVGRAQAADAVAGADRRRRCEAQLASAQRLAALADEQPRPPAPARRPLRRARRPHRRGQRRLGRHRRARQRRRRPRRRSWRACASPWRRPSGRRAATSRRSPCPSPLRHDGPGGHRPEHGEPASRSRAQRGRSVSSTCCGPTSSSRPGRRCRGSPGCCGSACSAS